MYISNILVSSVEINYEGCNSCDERVERQNKIVQELNHKHLYHISLAKEMPVFFVEGVESKMNFEKIN